MVTGSAEIARQLLMIAAVMRTLRMSLSSNSDDTISIRVFSLTSLRLKDYRFWQGWMISTIMVVQELSMPSLIRFTAARFSLVA